MSKGSKWKRLLRRTDDDEMVLLYEHLRAHRVKVEELTHWPNGVYKGAPREVSFMVALGDYPIALACLEDFRRAGRCP